MEKMDARKKYMHDKHRFCIDVQNSLYEDFKAKLKADKLTAREVIETAMYRYIHGDLHINKEKWK